MFAREGFVLIGVVAVLALILVMVGWQLSILWRIILFALAAALLAFTLYFFRDPERTVPEEAAAGRLVLAPADGKVVLVDENVHEPLYLKGPAKQVSIFLSPLNVHVNRIPVDGVVEYVNYVPGEYLVAWNPKASEKNERSEIGVRHPTGTRILFKQIAGAVARRIVYRVEQGDTVVAGDRFGIVKFGSRMDVLVPPHVRVDVDEGAVVTAGESVLAWIDEPPEGDRGAEAEIGTDAEVPADADVGTEAEVRANADAGSAEVRADLGTH